MLPPHRPGRPESCVSATLAAMQPHTTRRLGPLALVVAVHAITLPAFAEPPQKDLVQRGQELFDDQRYEESIQTLSGALVRPSNTPQQRIEIYRLLALDHITLGHKEEAENVVRALLSTQPDYELARTESPRFRDFFAEVRAKWIAAGRPGLVTPEGGPRRIAMKHSSPATASAGAEVALTANLDDPDHRVASVQLFYRAGSAGIFTAIRAQYAADGHVRSAIPRSAVKPPYVAYYVLATDAAGVPVASSGDADAPLRIPVPEASRGWVLPVAIGGGVLGVAGVVVGSLALAGAFKGTAAKGQSTVNISVMSFR
jgi:hypothetical protein